MCPWEAHQPPRQGTGSCARIGHSLFLHTVILVLSMCHPPLKKWWMLISWRHARCYGVMIWAWPPPSNSGKWRFIGIPYWKCNNPGGHCFCEGATSKLWCCSCGLNIFVLLRKRMIWMYKALFFRRRREESPNVPKDGCTPLTCSKVFAWMFKHV